MKRKINSRRWVLALLLVLALTAAITPPSAVAVKFGDTPNVPKDFWAVWTPYENALGSGDSAALVLSGDKVIAYWLKGVSAEQRAAEWLADLPGHGYEINNVWSVGNKVAQTYEELGDFANALRVYKISLAFVDPYKALILDILAGDPSDMEFARQKLQAKIDFYTTEVGVYAELRDGSGTVASYSAKHIPQSGVYYGEPAGAAIVDAKKPSSTLIYVEFESENLRERVENDRSRYIEKNGDKLGDYSVIEIAWNFGSEGAALKSVPGQTSKITEAAQYLKSLNTPILLRVGAEMNVWTTPADPDEFKEAFRSIAKIMRAQAPNVALVWSVNYVSAAGLSYEMFYPGDEYVDWVGISLYTIKYFQNNTSTSDEAASIYGTGKYADPIRYIRGLVEQYGHNKPILIAEGAVSLQHKASGEDLTEWALPQIRQTYAYIPMLFPQVKAMYWFNVNHPTSPMRYDLATSPAAQSLYMQLTSSDYFIGSGQVQSAVTYKKLGTAVFPADTVTLQTYVKHYNMADVAVQYKLDGVWKAQSAEVPYRGRLDLSGESDGAHKLTVQVLAENSTLQSLEYYVVKSGSAVTVSTAPVEIPVAPSVPAALKAAPTKSEVLVDGKPVAFAAYSITIGGATNNYFKLRDVAFVLEDKFDVDYVSGVITVTSGAQYVHPDGSEMKPSTGLEAAAVPTASKVEVDGKAVTLSVYKIGESNYFKLRDLGRAVGFDVSYRDGKILIEKDKPYTDD